MNIGEKIRQLRIKTNLTQSELAYRCDLSKGFISQLERGLTSPSIATLIDILECLGTNLKDFFNEQDNHKLVFDQDDAFTQENTELNHSICRIIPNAQKNIMEPILIKLKKHGKSCTYGPHRGEVFGYVIQGMINLNPGNQKIKAKKGESFYYGANTQYFIENSGNTEAVVLLVSAPPNF